MEGYPNGGFWRVEIQRGNVFCQVSRVQQRIGFQKLSLLTKIFKDPARVYYFVGSTSSRGAITEAIASQVFDKVEPTAPQFLEKKAKSDLLVIGPVTAVIDDEVEFDSFRGRDE